jgi:hypothetical protein
MTRVGSQRHRKKNSSRDRGEPRQTSVTTAPFLTESQDRKPPNTKDGTLPAASLRPPLFNFIDVFRQSFVRGLKKAETNLYVRMSSRFIRLATRTSCGFLVNTKMNLQVQSTDMTNESQKQVINPGCTDHGCQVVWTSTLCTMAPSVCGSSVSNLFLIIHLAPRMLWWLLDIRNTCAPLY